MGNVAPHRRPALHNAMWPGLVGKGSPGAEPVIDLDTMLDLTAQANVDGARFDGVDLFLFDPHTSIDASDDDLKRPCDKVAKRGFVVGSLVAPVWPPTDGGAAMAIATPAALHHADNVASLTPSSAAICVIVAPSVSR